MSLFLGMWVFPAFTLIPSATASPTPTPLPTPTCPSQYVIATGTNNIVPGTTDTGNHCDDCDTNIGLPFPFTLYEQTFNSVNVNSNGRLDFVTVNEPNFGFVPSCLPAPPNIGPYDYTIFVLWHDMRTDTGLSGCSTWANGCGIFTSLAGTAPNRIFTIEWHAVRFQENANALNFEVRLYENSAGTNKRFDVIYGAIAGVTELDAAGVQGPTGFFTQDFCGAVPPPANTLRIYTLPPCPTPTPTSTPTATATGTATFTPTPTATAIHSPTPPPPDTFPPTPTPTSPPAATVTPTPTAIA